jgi:hypothetical protein
MSIANNLLDCHGPRSVPNVFQLPYPPTFLLQTTFKLRIYIMNDTDNSQQFPPPPPQTHPLGIPQLGGVREYHGVGSNGKAVINHSV